MAEPFSYAVLRLVPDIERGEQVNVGVIVFCRPLDFLGARTALDDDRARALAPDVDLDAARRHLWAIERIAAGDPEAGPIAKLDTTKRTVTERIPDKQLFVPLALLAAILFGLDLLLSHTRLRRLP